MTDYALIDEDGTVRWQGTIDPPPGGSVPISSPLDIADCVLWLDPSQLALADDAAVATLPDSSPSGFNATQATALNRPVCKTATWNGLRVVRFDNGVNPQWLELSGAGLSLFRALDGFSIAIVSQLVDAGSDYVFEISTDGDASQEYIGYDHKVMVLPSGANMRGQGVGLGRQAGVYSCDAVGGTAGFDSSPPGNVATAGFAGAALTDAAAAAIVIGTQLDLAGNALDIGDIIVYERPLTAAERRELLEYLSAKWGTL